MCFLPGSMHSGNGTREKSYTSLYKTLVDLTLNTVYESGYLCLRKRTQSRTDVENGNLNDQGNGQLIL